MSNFLLQIRRCRFRLNDAKERRKLELTSSRKILAREISPTECSNFGINRTGSSSYVYISSQVAYLRDIRT